MGKINENGIVKQLTISETIVYTSKKGTLALNQKNKSMTGHLFLFTEYNCTTIGFIETLNLDRSQEQPCRTKATTLYK